MVNDYARPTPSTRPSVETGMHVRCPPELRSPLLLSPLGLGRVVSPIRDGRPRKDPGSSSTGVEWDRRPPRSTTRPGNRTPSRGTRVRVRRHPCQSSSDTLDLVSCRDELDVCSLPFCLPRGVAGAPRTGGGNRRSTPARHWSEGPLRRQWTVYNIPRFRSVLEVTGDSCSRVRPVPDPTRPGRTSDTHPTRPSCTSG